MRQDSDHQQAIRWWTAGQGSGSKAWPDLGVQLLPWRLLPPVHPLRLAELGPIVAASGACQDRSAGGVIAKARFHVIGQSWSSREGVGKELRGGGKLPLDATEVGEAEAFGCVGGLVLALEDNWESGSRASNKRSQRCNRRTGCAGHDLVEAG